MADLLKLSVEEVERIRESVDLTVQRGKSEGFEDPSETDEAIKEFCDLLLNGGSVDNFLTGQDMVIPEN